MDELTTGQQVSTGIAIEKQINHYAEKIKNCRERGDLELAEEFREFNQDLAEVLFKL